MKKLCFLACLAGLFQLGALESSSVKSSAPPTIKVLIVNQKPEVLLEVRGKYKIYDPLTMEHISTRFVGKRRYVQPLRQGLKWGEEFPGVFQLLIQPDDPRAIALVDGVPYRGSLYIYDVAGQIAIVNEVEIEKYLDALLSTQALNSLPEETLGALAIASRTQAYYQANHPKSTYWAIEAGQVGYSGSQEKNGTVEKALQTTKYLVMTRNEQTFNAIWEETRLPLVEAGKLATRGDSAADILKKAFPDTSLKIMQANPR